MGLGPNFDYRESHLHWAEEFERVYAKGYERWQWEFVERPLVRDTLARLAAEGATSLLDFACGTGRITVEACQFFSRVEGTDVSPDMLSIARDRSPRARLHLKDITKDPLEGSFDVVTAFRFFLNAQPSLRREALLAIRPLLVPSGVLIANVHVSSTSPLGLAYRVWNRLKGRTVRNALGRREFEAVLAECGYVVERTIRYSFWPRTGRYLVGVARRAIRPAERLGRARILPKAMAQCFIVIARPSTV